MYRRCQYISSIARISAESWIDLMFAKSSGMGWFYLVWFRSMWVKSEYFLFWFIIKLVWLQFTECLRPTFQLQNYFCTQYVWIFLASEVLIFTVHCSMKRQSPIGKILQPADLVKYVTVVYAIRFWLVVTLGTCGFITVRLSIFRTDLGTSMPLLKLMMGKWLR